MVRTAEYRTRKYSAKIDATVIANRFELLASHIRNQFNAKVPALVVIEGNIKQLCANRGIPSIELPSYYNVGRELYRVVTQHVGDARNLEAQIVVNKWATRGLNTTILTEIAKMFGITLTPVAWYCGER